MKLRYCKNSLPAGTVKSCLRLLIFGLAFSTACAYYRTYNSLHWAKEAYKQGITAQRDQEKQMRLKGISQTRAPEEQQSRQVTGEQYFEDCAKKCLFFLSQNQKSRKIDDALLLMGQAFYELRRYIQAENSLKTLLDTQQKSKLRDDAQYYLILVMLSTDDVSQAEVEIERLLDNHPKSKYRPHALYHLGRKRFRMGEYEQALEVFLGLKENYPKFELKGEVLSYICRVSFELGDYEKALAYYEELEKKGNNELQRREGLIGTARCHSRLGDHEKALEIYNQALQSAKFKEDRAEALLGINVEYTFLDRSAEAMNGFEEIIIETPRTEYSAAAWYELGLLYKGYSDNAQLDSIAADSTELLVFGFNTKALEPLVGLSQDLLALRLAERAFTQVRKDDPYSPLVDPAQQNIEDVGMLYQIVEQVEASDSTTSRDALARLQFLLAEYYETSGQLEMARAGYERLIFEYPNTIWTPKATLNLGRLCAGLGDSLRFRQSLELVVSSFPETRYADEARRELGLPVPERPSGFYLDELAAYSPPKITRAVSEEAAAGAAGAAPGHETWLQMRRRLWWARYGAGGGV
ncbi:MAG: tetratricopeptide repeat protein [Candidatus Glassbacteria bacterium]|nr:tetratricopeptide repeat protein [Candidatus Glassbacteria bacterium]